MTRSRGLNYVSTNALKLPDRSDSDLSWWYREGWPNGGITSGEKSIRVQEYRSRGIFNRGKSFRTLTQSSSLWVSA